jgi:hypothetical protein
MSSVASFADEPVIVQDRHPEDVIRREPWGILPVEQYLTVYSILTVRISSSSGVSGVIRQLNLSIANSIGWSARSKKAFRRMRGVATDSNFMGI